MPVTWLADELMTSQVRHLLVIAGARDITEVARRVRPDLTITAMVATGRLAKVRFPEACAKVVALDESAPCGEWVALARCVHSLAPLHAVGAFGEFDQDKGAAIAVALGLPFHPPEVIAAVYDKVLMRRKLRQAGTEDVPSAVVGSAGDLADFGDTYGFPLIVKPRNGTGSKAVVKLSCRNEVTGGFARAVQAAGAEYPALVAERYLQGREISVEAFSEHGAHWILGITDKSIDGNFVEMGHVVRAPAANDAQVVDYVARVLDALGITDGPTHTELILTKAGPRTVETHTRAGGDQIPQLLAAATGVDLIELAVRQVLGQRVGPMLDELVAQPGQVARFGVIRYLAPPRAGQLVSVTHTAEAAGLPFVTGCTVLKNPGDPLVTPIRDSVDRLAYCTAVAEDRTVAMEAAGQALSRLTVTSDDR